MPAPRSQKREPTLVEHLAAQAIAKPVNNILGIDKYYTSATLLLRQVRSLKQLLGTYPHPMCPITTINHMHGHQETCAHLHAVHASTAMVSAFKCQWGISIPASACVHCQPPCDRGMY